jgi:FkbM family methyltransferase
MAAPTIRARLDSRLRPRLRRSFLAVARRMTPYVAAAGREGVFLLSTHEAGMGRKVFVTNRMPEFDVLARAVSILREHGVDGGGSLFLDVGANIGTTTVPALLLHGYDRALCFEPDPDNATVLRANVALNRLSARVDVVEAAVSDTAGRAGFVRGPDTPLGRRTGVGSLHRPAQDEPAVEVDVVTLDESLARRGVEPSRVALLWIDAQGAEGHVLAGGRSLTDAGVPVVFALREHKLRKAGGVEPLLERLAGYGFYVDLREPGTATPVPAADLPERVGRKPNTDLLVF